MPTGTTGRWLRLDSSRTQPASTPVAARIEFSDAAAAAAQQFGGSAQHPPGVTAQADVAVGEQHRLPATRYPAADRTRRDATRGAAARGPIRWRSASRSTPSAGTPRRTRWLPNVQGHNPSRSSDRRTCPRSPRRSGDRRRARPASVRTGSWVKAGRRRGAPNIAHPSSARVVEVTEHRRAPIATVAADESTLGRARRPYRRDVVDGVHVVQFGKQQSHLLQCHAARQALQRRCRTGTSAHRAGIRASRGDAHAQRPPATVARHARARPATSSSARAHVVSSPPSPAGCPSRSEAPGRSRRPTPRRRGRWRVAPRSRRRVAR